MCIYGSTDIGKIPIKTLKVRQNWKWQDKKHGSYDKLYDTGQISYIVQLSLYFLFGSKLTTCIDSVFIHSDVVNILDLMFPSGYSSRNLWQNEK